MTRLIRKFVLTMIIGVTPICAVHAQSWFGGETRLPDPVAFSTQMELGDLGQAEAWLDAGLPADFLGSRIGSGLMIGAWEGNIALMRLFIARGADINQLNANGESRWPWRPGAARWRRPAGWSSAEPGSMRRPVAGRRCITRYSPATRK